MMAENIQYLSEDPLSTNGKWVANEDNARFAIYFYIEIVYISTHIGIESVSSDGFRQSTRMRQARSLQAPL
jgi:hypothetical protein